MSNSISSTENNNRNKIYDECVHIVYRQRAKNLYSHLFTSLLPLYLGWNGEGWLENSLLVSLLWVYVLSGFYFHPLSTAPSLQKVKIKSWANMLYFQMVLIGLLYNFMFINLAFHGAENAMVYLLLITALFSAGAVGRYQHLKGLSVTFIFSAMSFQLIYYLTMANVEGTLMAFVILIFIIFMSNIGFQLHKEAINTLTLNFELITANEKLEQLARTDALTSLNNRRSFFELGEILLKSTKRHRRPLSVVMLDIDNFKFINDSYGHPVGDEVLKAVASTLIRGVRDSDFTGRVGGEEFGIILPETNLPKARELVERIRKAVEQTNIHIEGQDISVTASFGIAEYKSEDNHNFEKLISKADIVLYRAKNGGKNRIETFK